MQLERVRGDTSPDQITIKDGKVNANLSGCVVKMSLNTSRNPVDSVNQVYQIIGVIDDPASGVVKFYPTEEQADQIGFFYYDIQLTDVDGRVHTLFKDAYVYIQDITK